MTAGLPGTGIGGMFYLMSALATPLSQAYRMARGRAEAGAWRVVAGQTTIAGGILAGMWAAGWLLGLVLAASQPVVSPDGPHADNALQVSALAVSLGTLVTVLLGVQLLRLLVHRRVRREPAIERRDVHEPLHAAQPPVAVRRDTLTVVAGTKRWGWRRQREQVLRVLLAMAVAAASGTLAAQSVTPPADRLARAESAYAAGDATTAEREYAAVLAVAPWNSRATYRLAELRRRDPAEALRLFRRYVELEPTDPWGYMAVGDVLAKLGHYGGALAWYDRALRLAPGEPDAVVGRARIERQRLRAAPAVTPLIGGSRDSDGNTTFRFGSAADLPAFGPARLGVVANRDRVSDGFTTTSLGRVSLHATWQPRPTVVIEATAGTTTLDAVRAESITVAPLSPPDPPGRPPPPPPPPPQDTLAAPNQPGGRGRAAESATVFPTGELRARWRAPAGGPAVDLRAQRSVLAASPLLVTNRVVRTELRALVDLPVARPLRFRAIGRAAALNDSADVNHRTAVGGVVALAVAPATEVSAQFHEIRYSRPSAAGYFAPRLAQVIEAGTYWEFETAGAAVFAFDAGVGVHRVAEHGAALGAWRRALRLYALITLPLAPGRDVRLELEGEDSPIANEAATAAGWRYGSASLSLRWAL